MMRMFPVKDDYISDQIERFPFLVTSHRDKGPCGIQVISGEITEPSWEQKMNIDHDLEVIHPWFYSTYLIDEEIRVSFTPGKKSAIYQFNFPPAKRQNLLIQGSDEFRCAVLDASSFALEEKILHTPKGPNAMPRTMSFYVYGMIVGSNNPALKRVEIQSDDRKLVISFPKSGTSPVFLKYAVSYVSLEQARLNFQNELADQDFAKLAGTGQEEWSKVCSRIEVEGGTEAQKRTFYSALYRTSERMVDINEYGTYYSGYDGNVHKSTRPFYVDDWIWDTYLALHPLRTILYPEMENDMLNSYTLMYEQSGWMPTFPQVYGNHQCMNAYHSSAIFVDGYRKGLKNYDVEKAYEGIRKNLTQGSFIPWRQGTPRTTLDDFFHKHGYFPSLHPGEAEKTAAVDDFEKRQPVAVTLGVSYDFWALAQFAKALGKTEDYAEFFPKGKNYKNLWHPDIRLFMPKDHKGKWIYIDPKADGGPGYRHFYDENNGWTYAWDVKQDIAGLTELLGGKKSAEERLDQLFREPLGMKKKEFVLDGSNSTGMVGQFSMGNEPSFHIPYLYNYFGAPWKTQQRTRFLLDVWFKDNIFGIPGDEDGGGMTAFVVFSSIGIYPVTPGLPFYSITSPLFEKVTLHLENGKKFTVIAKGAGKVKKYIQRAFINGTEIDGPFITHDQIMSGCTLELELSELPDKAWGANAKTPE
jgi:predicted alpha-1,2-mannosidase